MTENGMAKLFFTMLAAFAEFERGRIAERTAEGRKSSAAGGHLGGPALSGYHKVGAGKNAMLEPIPWGAGRYPPHARASQPGGKACGPSLPPSPPSSTCRSLPWRLTVF